jgi:hypothetical protein
MEPDTIVETGNQNSANSVWATIQQSISNLAGTYRSVQETRTGAAIEAARIRAGAYNTAPSGAAPSGFLQNLLSNPAPGMFGFNPQADTKARFDSPQAATVNPLFLLVGAVLLLFVLARR